MECVGWVYHLIVHFSFLRFSDLVLAIGLFGLWERDEVGWWAGFVLLRYPRLFFDYFLWFQQ